MNAPAFHQPTTSHQSITVDHVICEQTLHHYHGYYGGGGYHGGGLLGPLGYGGYYYGPLGYLGGHLHLGYNLYGGYYLGGHLHLGYNLYGGYYLGYLGYLGLGHLGYGLGYNLNGFGCMKVPDDEKFFEEGFGFRQIIVW
ncbi:unnamed protein product [Rotaria socialis]